MGLIEPGTVVTGSHRQGRPKQVQPGNREWITVIEGINTEGQSIPPFIIGSGQYHIANWYQDCDLVLQSNINSSRVDFIDPL
ncbi:transposase [Fusarium oxysporum f. sp. phaseoli]